MNVLVYFALWSTLTALHGEPAPTNTGPGATAAAPAPTQQGSSKRAAQPILDELLGIKPATQPKPTTPGVTPPQPAPGGPSASRIDLERALSGEELEDAFKKAVTLMGDAAGRLDSQRDAGLDTQRMQEEALANLESVLKSMQKNQSQQSQSQKPQSKPEQQNQPRPQQSQGKKPSTTPNQSGDPNVPTLQEGALNSVLDSARAAWGALPERVREMLLQGSNDRFSARYQRLTEEYYRRLAQEAGKQP